MRQARKRFAEWVSWLGVSQSEVGRRIQCSQEMVSKLISGNRNAGRDIAINIERESSDWPDGPIYIHEWSASDNHSLSSIEGS